MFARFTSINIKSLRNIVCISSNKCLHYDVVIAGGGVMGASSAYFVKQKAPEMSVAVIERDTTFNESASSRSVASIRQQFSTTENIALSQWSYKFMNEIEKHLTVDSDNPPDVQMKRSSYSFLASDKGVDILKHNCALQKSCGADIYFLDPEQLNKRFEWLNTEGIAGGSICEDSQEGWFDGWSLLSAFNLKSKSLGVEYINANVDTLDIGSKVNGVEISNGEERRYVECSNFINTAGPWAGELMEKVGIYLPVFPRKRYVFVFDCPKGPGREMPLMVDPTGVYCRPEGHGTMFLSGCSPTEEEEPDISNLDVDYDYFDNNIWPILAERCRGMEELKVKHSWAGYYDYNTFDQNGIISGHPDIDNLFFANGFSGHGIQQSPAVGNAISELIIDKKFITIDLSRFSYNRLHENAYVKEINVV